MGMSHPASQIQGLLISVQMGSSFLGETLPGTNTDALRAQMGPN